MNHPAPVLTQPRTGSVTKIATERDVRDSATILAGMLGKVMAAQRELDAKLEAAHQRLVSTEAHAQRLVTLLQAASSDRRTST
jgi:hypothetical protein